VTPDASQFSIETELRDPAVREGYNEQDAVVRAAALVRSMREAAGLSQSALAAQIGTSQAHLSMLERGVGRQGPTFLILQKIATACGQELHISVLPVSRRAMTRQYQEHQFEAAAPVAIATGAR